MGSAQADNPGGYITDMITEDPEFPLNLVAELLTQWRVLEQWFNHQWTVGYAMSNLSDWGTHHCCSFPDSRTMKTF